MKPNDMYFPIAACAGCDHPDAADYDKRWLVVDENGRLVTRDEFPLLGEIAPAIRFGYLAIKAPGMLRMDIPLDVIEDDDSVRRVATIGTQKVDVVDEGDLAATWLTNYLKAPCRLMKVHPDAGKVDWPVL
ncbi:MAG TPA: MOSC N-terminal beta barrel domain-containing protein [Burkholderiaceae bacterium]|nr:MOSC N-terminal beta barrel domain-containing protein [Burkholderiaceae bacterium]